jgi:hypothetical protein
MVTLKKAPLQIKEPKKQQSKPRNLRKIKKMYTHQALVLQLHTEKLSVIHLLQALSKMI